MQTPRSSSLCAFFALASGLVCEPASAQVDGLTPGETIRDLAPAAPSVADAFVTDVDEYRHGRVLDAFTGRVMTTGARVELWTEEIDAHFGGFHRVGEALSGVDGRFSARQIDGAHGRAEKARITAPGYLTLSCTAGDLYDPVWLFPADAQPSPRIRIVDTFGRPIAGARITSTLSCAHDLPAFEAETDARGIAELHGLGLQDSVPELRVRARGHLAEKYLDADALVSGPRDAEVPKTFVLPRAEPFAARVLRRDGEPAANDAIYLLDGDGYQVERCDAEGVVRFPIRYGSGAVILHTLEEGDSRFVAELDPRGAFTPTIRRLSYDWPDEVPTGSIELVADGDGDRPMVSAYHADGWSLLVDGDSRDAFEFPAGRVHLTVGGSFTGRELQEFDLDLEPGATWRCAIRGIREPRIVLRVVGAADERAEPYLWVESAVGASRLDVPIGEPFPVPEAPLVVGFVTDRGKVMVERLPAIHDGMVVEIEVPSPEVKASEQQATQQLLFRSVTTGKFLDGALGRDGVRSDPVSKLHEFDGPLGQPWLVRFQAEGCMPIWVRGRFGDAPSVHDVPSPAKLELPGLGEDFEIVGGGGLDLDRLAPGPLQLVLEWRDGRRKGLSIVLESGAHRRIQVAD